MAKEFDPLPREPLRNDTLRNDSPGIDPVVRERGTGMGMIGLLAGLAVAIVVGLMFWNMADKTTATNTSPGVTTGASTTTPPTTTAPTTATPELPQTTRPVTPPATR